MKLCSCGVVDCWGRVVMALCGRGFVELCMCEVVYLLGCGVV